MDSIDIRQLFLSSAIPGPSLPALFPVFRGIGPSNAGRGEGGVPKRAFRRPPRGPAHGEARRRGERNGWRFRPGAVWNRL